MTQTLIGLMSREQKALMSNNVFDNIFYCIINIMKRNILILSLAMLAVVATSCKKEDDASLCKEAFHGKTEQPNTKTHLVSDNDLSLKWDLDLTTYPEDIIVYAQTGTDGDGNPVYDMTEYTASEVTVGGTKAKFDVAHGACVTGSTYKAFYPADLVDVTTHEVWTLKPGYQERTWHNQQQVRPSGSGGTWTNVTIANRSTYYDRTVEPTYGTTEIATTMTLPTTQLYKDLSMRQSPMMAETENGSRDLQFFNMCGGLELYFQEEGINITHIELVTDNQMISGQFPINDGMVIADGETDIYNRNHDYLETRDRGDVTAQNENWNTVTLDCTNNINPDGSIGVDITNGENFYITLPVGEYESFYIVAYSEDGQQFVKKLRLEDGHSFIIQRSKFSRIAFHNPEFRTPPGTVPGEFSVSPNHHVYFAHGNLWYAPYLGSPWANEPNDAAGYQWYIAYEQFDNFATGTDPYGYNGGANADKYLDGSANYVNPYNWYGDIAQNVSYNTRTESTPKQQDKWELYCWSNGGAGYSDFGRTTINNTNSDSPLVGGAYTEWGSNPIYNGTSVPNQWRTLTGGTNGEWHYLLMKRKAASAGGQYDDAQPLDGTPFNGGSFVGSNNEGARWALVMVAGVPGLLIFPDHYTWPAGVPKPKYINTITKNANTYIDWINEASNDVPNYTFCRAQVGDDVDYDLNDPSCPLSMNNEFRRLELEGFVFLPCVGQRNGYDIRYCGGLNNPTTGEDGSGWGQCIRYYSATPAGSDLAYYLGVKLSGNDRMDIIAGDVADNSEGLINNNRYWGRAIRLVMDVQ